MNVSELEDLILGDGLEQRIPAGASVLLAYALDGEPRAAHALVVTTEDGPALLLFPASPAVERGGSDGNA
jgi:hypothetical protein